MTIRYKAWVALRPRDGQLVQKAVPSEPLFNTDIALPAFVRFHSWPWLLGRSRYASSETASEGGTSSPLG